MQGECLPAEREMEIPFAQMQARTPTENFGYHVQGAIPNNIYRTI